MNKRFASIALCMCEETNIVCSEVLVEFMRGAPLCGEREMNFDLG